ncbi:hypothetical protein GQ53DRAFT_26912 [Thozetella sp. PMI_491]|nr:hypothetical protein GQ53DRAFT_26912 [Thozetella sp. PMI_491]
MQAPLGTHRGKMARIRDSQGGGVTFAMVVRLFPAPPVHCVVRVAIPERTLYSWDPIMRPCDVRPRFEMHTAACARIVLSLPIPFDPPQTPRFPIQAGASSETAGKVPASHRRRPAHRVLRTGSLASSRLQGACRRYLAACLADKVRMRGASRTETSRGDVTVHCRHFGCRRREERATA